MFPVILFSPSVVIPIILSFQSGHNTFKTKENFYKNYINNINLICI